VARYWSISAVPVSAHPSPLVITTKLAAAILVVAVVRRRGSAGPVLPLYIHHKIDCFVYKNNAKLLSQMLENNFVHFYRCALNAAPSSRKKDVRPSDKCMNCDKTEEKSVHILHHMRGHLA